MLHDIDGVYDNHYRERAPHPDDFALSFHGESLLAQREDDALFLPTFASGGFRAEDAVFLFCIDEAGYYLVGEEGRSAQASPFTGIDIGQVESPSDSAYSYIPLRDYRWIRPRETRFAVEVASQLAGWYRDNRFCGRCGTRLEPDRVERMLRCPRCGNMVYPRINPGVIVGVVDGERMLLTQYAGRGFTSWALVAGFTEIGESLEQTVEREVLEETGVHVKNIRYFGNQPWPRSSSLLVGYYAELEGSGEIRLDDHELAHAEWVHWSEVPHEPDDYSLTRTMMCAFHDRFASGDAH